MNSRISRIETLDHPIERWAAMIAATTLAGILLSAQNVFHAVRDLVGYGPQARLRLQLKALAGLRLFSMPWCRSSSLSQISATTGKIGEDCKIVLSIKSRSMANRRITRMVETRMSGIKAVELDVGRGAAWR